MEHTLKKVTPSASTGVDGIPTTAYQSLMQLQPGITKSKNLYVG